MSISDLLRIITGNGKLDTQPKTASANPARTTAAPSDAARGGATPPHLASTGDIGGEEKSPRHAIILRRSALPVPEDHTARSFIGGLPRMPVGFEWPSAEV